MRCTNLVKIYQLLQDLTEAGLLYEVDKSCQNISTTVGFTESRAFPSMRCTNFVKTDYSTLS